MLMREDEPQPEQGGTGDAEVGGDVEDGGGGDVVAHSRDPLKLLHRSLSSHMHTVPAP
jgi:hypothetical protein